MWGNTLGTKGLLASLEKAEEAKKAEEKTQQITLSQEEELRKKVAECENSTRNAYNQWQKHIDNPDVNQSETKLAYVEEILQLTQAQIKLITFQIQFVKGKIDSLKESFRSVADIQKNPICFLTPYGVRDVKIELDYSLASAKETLRMSFNELKKELSSYENELKEKTNEYKKLSTEIINLQIDLSPPKKEKVSSSASREYVARNCKIIDPLNDLYKDFASLHEIKQIKPKKESKAPNDSKESNGPKAPNDSKESNGPKAPNDSKESKTLRKKITKFERILKDKKLHEKKYNDFLKKAKEDGFDVIKRLILGMISDSSLMNQIFGSDGSLSFKLFDLPVRGTEPLEPVKPVSRKSSSKRDEKSDEADEAVEKYQTEMKKFREAESKYLDMQEKNETILSIERTVVNFLMYIFDDVIKEFNHEIKSRKFVDLSDICEDITGIYTNLLMTLLEGNISDLTVLQKLKLRKITGKIHFPSGGCDFVTAEFYALGLNRKGFGQINEACAFLNRMHKIHSVLLKAYGVLAFLTESEFTPPGIKKPAKDFLGILLQRFPMIVEDPKITNIIGKNGKPIKYGEKNLKGSIPGISFGIGAFVPVIERHFDLIKSSIAFEEKNQKAIEERKKFFKGISINIPPNCSCDSLSELKKSDLGFASTKRKVGTCDKCYQYFVSKVKTALWFSGNSDDFGNMKKFILGNLCEKGCERTRQPLIIDGVFAFSSYCAECGRNESIIPATNNSVHSGYLQTLKDKLHPYWTSVGKRCSFLLDIEKNKTSNSSILQPKKPNITVVKQNEGWADSTTSSSSNAVEKNKSWADFTSSDDEPDDEPGIQPGIQPDIQPSNEPGIQPDIQPSNEPSNEPGNEPGNEPDIRPEELDDRIEDLRTQFQEELENQIEDLQRQILLEIDRQIENLRTQIQEKVENQIEDLQTQIREEVDRQIEDLQTQIQESQNAQWLEFFDE